MRACLLAYLSGRSGFSLLPCQMKEWLSRVRLLAAVQIVMTRVEHELILVRLENQLWVCDAGQGSSTPIEPVLLTSDLLDVDNTEGKGIELLVWTSFPGFVLVRKTRHPLALSI